MIDSPVCTGPHLVTQGVDDDKHHDLVVVTCDGTHIAEFDLGPRTSIDRSPEIRAAVTTAMRDHERSVLLDLLGRCLPHLDTEPELCGRVGALIAANA